MASATPPATGVLNDFDAVVVLSVASSMLGILGGTFSVGVILFLRLHRQFSLMLVHSACLLAYTVGQVGLWPALVYSRPYSVTTQQQVCHAFKLLEIMSRTVANIASSAMMYWYMDLNRMMSGQSSNSLPRINKKSMIYFCVFTIVSFSIIIGELYHIAGTLNGTTACYIIVTGSKKTEVLRAISLQIPVYAPLIFGMVFFMLARTTWINTEGPVCPESVHSRINSLFYWLNWSFVMCQFPVFVCALAFYLDYQNSLREVNSVVIHLASLQTVLDGLVFYFILIKRAKRCDNIVIAIAQEPINRPPGIPAPAVRGGSSPLLRGSYSLLRGSTPTRRSSNSVCIGVKKTSEWGEAQKKWRAFSSYDLYIGDDSPQATQMESFTDLSESLLEVK